MPEVNRLIGKHLFPGVGSNIWFPNLIIVLLHIVLRKITTNTLSQRSQFKNVQLSDKQIFTVFIKQSSAEKLKGLGHAILGNFSTDQMAIELSKI